jgi:hypothetical protein
MHKAQYPSRYSNGKDVSAAQYITEIICEHKAKLSNIDLHYRFWLTKEWSRYYRNQIGSANKLLKKYHPKAIIKALNDTKSAKIYSLRAPHLLGIIDQYQKIVEQENTELSMDYDRKDNIVHRKANNSKPNIISKLRDLE